MHLVLFQLPEILKSLRILKIKDEMPCFDPEDVLFVTNKWDQVTDHKGDKDENEEIAIWENIKSNLIEIWPLVKEENIFRLNLREVIILCA